ncbi:[FeFe] hydrogenase H-cluster radical SAM maturase HydE [Paramaledivibacter caminithermalis]|jgi:biotin synthase|uniref:Iron-only hydrogenase maturation protein HydE n=1 Tax=Paramaledivibacter caminithermalis (strain DSM 15212 / CIP 107654 / DViRD3) TaxID=1121301 RepID=A0A1M6LYI7_PARC5|nr:[FeFe] hydrogenase H-cluster radical SAM maturase HydE [Paramaledivibacter caminithermalis]SHJ76264.1 iron-only hydrogenase maturation protein HydE [Paramaledivibacter caminithermalis DSM 15212]
MKKILNKLYSTNNLERRELIKLLSSIDNKHKKILFEYADIVRKKIYGKKVFLRGIIEFSNYCKNSCMYCGLYASNKIINRYRMSKFEIMECCKKGYEMGYRTFVLQSGEDPYYTDEMLKSTISSIKHAFPDAAITLSIGERTKLSFNMLFNAGADRYLLRHEAAEKNLYEKLHPHMSHDNRINCLKILKDIGYQVGAGFIVGLPNQSLEDIVEDLMFLKNLNPHMVGIGPFISHPQTPLKNSPNGSVDMTIICLSIIRLLLPHVLLPATTALRCLDAHSWERSLKAGANVIMTNLTPQEQRKKYDIYKGKGNTADNANTLTVEVKDLIKNAGYEVDMGRGDHISISKLSLI